MATGLLAGIHAARLLGGAEPIAPPRATALGSLCHYITHADSRNYQPANMAFDLLPPLCSTSFEGGPRKIDRAARHARQCEIALVKLADWLALL